MSSTVTLPPGAFGPGLARTAVSVWGTPRDWLSPVAGFNTPLQTDKAVLSYCFQVHTNTLVSWLHDDWLHEFL